MMKKVLVALCFVLSMFSVSTYAQQTGSVSSQLVFSTLLASQKDTALTSLETQTKTIQVLYDTTLGTTQTKANYQSLVCLGVFDSADLWQQIAAEKETIRQQILNDVLDLDTKFFALQNRKNLGLVDDAQYTTEKSALEAEASQIATKYLAVVQNYVKKYSMQIPAVAADVQSYTLQNTQLIGSLRDKMSAINTTFDQYQLLKTTIFQYNNLKGGNEQIVQLFTTQKSVLGMLLDKELQKIMNRQSIKTVPGLQNILAIQKDAVVSLYMSDYEAALNNAVGNRYDIATYSRIEDNIGVIKSTFFSGSIIDCPKILTTSIDVPTFVATTQKQIADMLAVVSKNLTTASTSGAASPQIVKIQLFSVFKSFYVDRMKKDITTFIKYALEQKDRIQPPVPVIEQSVVTTPVVTTPSVSTKYEIDAKFRFTEPFARGYTGYQVAILQKLLTNIGFYTGAINSKNTSATVDAVYRFQLSKNILVGYENKPETRGWMGPATRQALNDVIINQKW